MPPVVSKQTAKPAVKGVVKKAASVWDGVGDIEVDTHLKILLYGRSATGKTTLWSSFPGPILSIICSGGVKSGELKSVSKADRAKIKSIQLEDTTQILELAAGAVSRGFKTVVLDHSSGLQDKVLADILGVDEVPVQKSWGLASQQQYGQCTAQCKELLRALINVDANVVVVAQQRTFDAGEDGGTGLLQPYVGGMMTPALFGWLAPAMDYVCQTFIRSETKEVVRKIGGKDVKQEIKTGKKQYCLRTGVHDIFASKFRIPREFAKQLPECVVDPTYAKVIKLIESGKE